MIGEPTTGVESVPTDRELQLADVFVELTAVLTGDYDIHAYTYRLSRICVEFLRATAAGIILQKTTGDLQLLVSSSDRMRLVELTECQTSEGPCYEALSEDRPAAEPELESAGVERWPTFAPRALEAGFRSVYAVPMRLREKRIGALNLFSDQTDALDARTLRLAQALADMTTIALTKQQMIEDQSELSRQLQAALTSRIAIEQAKGMIAEDLDVDVEEAFAVLRRASRSNNVRLIDLAQAVVDRALSPAALGGTLHSSPDHRS